MGKSRKAGSKVEQGSKFYTSRPDGHYDKSERFFRKQDPCIIFSIQKTSREDAAEACAFRDSYDVFVEAGAQVIGISPQSVDSHKKFAILNKLPFVLLRDENGKLGQLYGVPSTLGPLPGRVTYIIDKKGTVRHIFSSQLNATKHIEEAIKIINEISRE